MVYANYGRQQDFYWLQSSGVSVVGSVVVIRVGGGATFAEKVWLAEKNGAGGVLIYPDPADLPQDPRRLGLNTHTSVSEHVTHTHTHVSTIFLLLPNHSLPPSEPPQVHLGSGDPFTPGFPSFNHTQFPSIQSSGLPLIPVLPVSATVAAQLLRCVRQPQVELRWRWDVPDLCVSQPADRSTLSPPMEGPAALRALCGWTGPQFWTQGQDEGHQRDDAGPAQQHLLVSGGPSGARY